MNILPALIFFGLTSGCKKEEQVPVDNECKYSDEVDSDDDGNYESVTVQADGGQCQFSDIFEYMGDESSYSITLADSENSYNNFLVDTWPSNKNVSVKVSSSSDGDFLIDSFCDSNGSSLICETPAIQANATNVTISGDGRLTLRGAYDGTAISGTNGSSINISGLIIDDSYANALLLDNSSLTIRNSVIEAPMLSALMATNGSSVTATNNDFAIDFDTYTPTEDAAYTPRTIFIDDADSVIFNENIVRDQESQTPLFIDAAYIEANSNLFVGNTGINAQPLIFLNPTDEARNHTGDPFSVNSFKQNMVANNFATGGESLYVFNSLRGMAASYNTITDTMALEGDQTANVIDMRDLARADDNGNIVYDGNHGTITDQGQLTFDQNDVTYNQATQNIAARNETQEGVGDEVSRNNFYGNGTDTHPLSYEETDMPNFSAAPEYFGDGEWMYSADAIDPMAYLLTNLEETEALTQAEDSNWWLLGTGRAHPGAFNGPAGDVTFATAIKYYYNLQEPFGLEGDTKDKMCDALTNGYDPFPDEDSDTPKANYAYLMDDSFMADLVEESNYCASEGLDQSYFEEVE